GGKRWCVPPRRCSVRKLLAVLAVSVVLVIAVAIVTPFLIPTEAYKIQLVTLVEQTTGREFKIAGPLRLSLLPRPAIEADDVSLANAPGVSTSPMAELKQLRIELEWLPLFHRALVVSRTVMVQPLIALEVDKAGRPNWVLGPGAASAAVPHGPLPSGLVGGGF